MADLLLKFPIPCEPKRVNRWLLKFPKSMTISEWCVSETSRPSVSVIKGKRVVNPITIVLRDPIGPSTSQSIYYAFEALHGRKTSLFKRLISIFKKDKAGFDYELDLLDPTGVTIEKWVILGCKFKHVEFGNLTYSKDGIVEIKIVLQPEDFKLIF